MPLSLMTDAELQRNFRNYGGCMAGGASRLLNAAALTILGTILAKPGYPPSVRELCKATGRSQNAIVGHLRRLRKLGLIDYADSKPRTLRPTCTFLYA